MDFILDMKSTEEEDIQAGRKRTKAQYLHMRKKQLWLGLVR